MSSPYSVIIHRSSWVQKLWGRPACLIYDSQEPAASYRISMSAALDLRRLETMTVSVKASRLPCSDGCPDSDEWPSLYDARQPCPLSWSVRDHHGSRTPPETRHGTPSTFCCRWLGWRTSWSRPDNSTTRSLPVNTLSSLMPDLLTVNEYSPHSISFNIYGWQ